MADTIVNIATQVHGLLGDGNPSDRAIGPWRLWKIIESQMHLIGAQAGMGQSWATAAFTTADGTSDYALPSNQYAYIVMLKDATNGRIVEKRTKEFIEGLRNNVPAASIPRGFPEFFALYEQTSGTVATATPQVVTVRLYPTPNGVYSMDLLRSLLPTDLADTGDVVPFAIDLMAALKLRSARAAALAMSPEQREKRNITQALLDDWAADAERLMRLGAERIATMKRAGYANG